MSDKVKGIIFLFLSAFLYGLNVPISKYYLNDLSSNELLFFIFWCKYWYGFDYFI